jgi:hypothetical protein
MGFEPMNTGFADQRVSHFATGARVLPPRERKHDVDLDYFGCAAVRR